MFISRWGHWGLDWLKDLVNVAQIGRYCNLGVSDPKSCSFQHCTGGRLTMKLMMKLYTSTSYTHVYPFHGRCSSDMFQWSYAFGKFAKLNDFNHNQLWLLSVSILTPPSHTLLHVRCSWIGILVAREKF